MAVFGARKNTNLFVGSRQVYGMIIMEVTLGVFYSYMSQWQAVSHSCTWQVSVNQWWEIYYHNWSFWWVETDRIIPRVPAHLDWQGPQHFTSLRGFDRDFTLLFFTCWGGIIIPYTLLFAYIVNVLYFTGFQ